MGDEKFVDKVYQQFHAERNYKEQLKHYLLKVEEAKKYPPGAVTLPAAPVKKNFDIKIKKEE
jgi:hypothetical protein